MTRKQLSVSLPWSLSHYIPLNGFHPLYRALIDHAPNSIVFNAWDNVKLQSRLEQDNSFREYFLTDMRANEQAYASSKINIVQQYYYHYFWAPDRILTASLPGDIEFHHTSPFPSFTRPFVFHCESFMPIFLPLLKQDNGLNILDEPVKKFYQDLFTHPLCLGIFSHIPETLESFRQYFASTDINKKLICSAIGLSQIGTKKIKLSNKSSLTTPKFLFTNSTYQDPNNFFLRGGHIILKFWKEFVEHQRLGQLILRCAKPTDEDLLKHNVDLSFIRDQEGKSILWIQDYLSITEQQALVSNAHFFLLPSSALHSASILEAMGNHVIPIVTDTIGTSVYVNDDENGVVLNGIRSALSHTDLNTNRLLEQNKLPAEVELSLVNQLTRRIFALLDNPSLYKRIQHNAIKQVRSHFSGSNFSEQFWEQVHDLYDEYPSKQTQEKSTQPLSAPIANISRSPHKSKKHSSGNTIRPFDYTDCLINQDWGRIFNSVTQPSIRICTGANYVVELGGTYIHIPHHIHRTKLPLQDLSVMTPYYNASQPRSIRFAYQMHELGSLYLNTNHPNPTDSDLIERTKSKAHRYFSNLLIPYPRIHHLAAMISKKLRELTWRNNSNPEITLLLEGRSGYNIIQCKSKYYAILQKDGKFSQIDFKKGKYSSSYSSYFIMLIYLQIALKNLKSRLYNFAFRVYSKLILLNNNPNSEIELLFQGIAGYNIIRHKYKYYTISQRDGSFNLEAFRQSKYSLSHSSHSLISIFVFIGLTRIKNMILR